MPAHGQDQSLASAAESDHMATTRPKKIPLASLQEAARLATRAALEPFGRIPDDVELTLGTRWKEDEVVFELYIAKDRPTDAVVLTEACVNQYDGQVRSVRVFEEAMAGVMATGRP
jgi:hypothetical protein